MGVRESEIIFLRKYIPIVNRAYFPESIDEYGGEGESIIKNYTRDVSILKAVLRLVIELLKYLILPRYFRVLKRKSKIFKNNNFNF